VAHADDHTAELGGRNGHRHGCGTLRAGEFVTAIRRHDHVLVLALGALACAVAGATAVHPGSLPVLVTAGLCALAIAVIFGEVGFGALLIWVGLSGPLFPLLSIGATDTPLSFDRLMIAGMGTWLVFGRPGLRLSPQGRRLAWGLALLLVAYGVRAALTHHIGPASSEEGDARTAAINTWIDAIVLPATLYLIVARFALTREICLRLAGAMAVGGAILGSIGIAEKLAGFELSTFSGGEERIDTSINVVRVAGPYSVPEVFGVVLLMCMAATLWWMLARGSAVWPWGLVAIGLELGGIAVTLFRAAAIGAILVLICGLGLRPGRVLRMVGVMLLAGCVLYLVYTQLESNRVFESRVANTENINGRFATYQQGADVFASHPLVGVGIGQFANAQTDVQVTVVNGVKPAQSPHSTFVGTLGEQGLAGFVPLLFVTYAIWRLLGELRRRARDPADVVLWGCLVGAALAYLIMSLTLTMLPYGASNAFFAILLGVAAARSAALGAEDAE
jgi:O-antigen ligase